ncbi:MAG: site-specific integrase [Reichenbachiella sp.]
MKHTYSTLFYIKPDKRSKSKDCPIFLRITVNGKRTELSINRTISPDRWDSGAGKAKGYKADVKSINELIDTISAKINRIHSNLIDNQEDFTALRIKDIFLGTDKEQKSVVEVFEHHNKQVQDQIGIDFSNSTFKRYETTLSHLKEFMMYQYKIEDIKLKELKYQFVTDLEFYLKTKRLCNHNSTLKYIRNFRKIINMAVKNDWVEKDPFIKYQVKLKETKRGYLTEDELLSIENNNFKMSRLEQVRDVFVFCCYTGMSYVDVSKLTPHDVSKGLDGEYWIFTERTKTGTSSNVPLLPKAIDIINKYKDQPNTLNTEHLLPVASNQKMNAYLKEIATLCEIEKTLTFHMARHTFATTVTLTNGVSIETVSSMLGHKNMRTTQIYAKVVEKKVSNDMKALKEVLKNTSKKASNQ